MIIFSNLKIHFLILGIFSTLNTITLSEELSPKKTSYITEEEQAKLKPKGHTWQLGYNLFFNRYHNITNSRGSKFFNKNIQYTSNKETIVYNLPTINIVHDMSVNNSNNSTFPNTSHFSLPTIQIPEIQQISLSYSGKVPIINSAYINFNGNSSQSSYFSQQNINSNSPNSQGKMDIVITNQKVNIKTDNIKFTGIQDQNHNIVSTTTDNLNIDGQLLPNIFTSTSAQPLTIDNIILDISNNTKPNLDELETLKSSIFLITPYQSAILGDMSITLGHNFNLNFNANSSISFVSVADSNRDSYNVGYINNGYIEAKGIKSLIFLHTKPEFTNHTGMSFLQNNGTLKLSGERIMGIGEFGVPTSFENNGEFIIGGFNNVGLYYLNISTPSELILNSPIRIIGNNSMGIVTLGNTQFANPETIKIHTNQNAYESTNPNIHSTAKYRAGGKSGFYRPAKINIEITGNQNIAFNALNLTSETAFPVYLDNYTITSYLGNNNVLMRYYLFNSVELKNDVIGSLKIVGGEKNTALRIFKTNLNHTGNITITDSIQSIGVYNSEGHFINNGTIEVSSPSGFGLISNNAINENYGTINLTEKLDILNDFQHNYSIGVLLSNHSHFLSTGNLTIDVTNYNSAGILANKESNAILSNTIINAKNGARNMGVTQGGSITLDTNNRFNTYENSLFIYNTPDNPGKIIFKNPVTANIYGNHTHYAYGTGLFLNGDNREDFTTFLKNYDTNYHENTLKNLTLNLIHGRGFYIKDFSLNLSDTDITSLKEYGGPNITGQDYKTLLMDNSHLTIDKDVNLDTENLLSKIDIINSSITNNATITNKNNGGIGLSEFPANTNQHNTIINNGNIEFGGSRSIGILVPNTGIFNVQNDNLIKLYGSDVLPTIGIYNRNPLGTIINNKDIISSGNINYGIYSVGDIINNGTIDFSQGVGNIGILNLGIKTSTNNHTIIVGASSPKLKLYGIGMVAKNDDHSYSSNLHTVVINEGSIDVNGNYGIGMYADGSNSKIINKGSINLNGEHTIGMFIDHGATGENYGRIIATPNAINSIGALLKGGSTFINYGEIIINSPKSTDVMIEKGSNYQQINDNATNIEYIPPSSSNEIKIIKSNLDIQNLAGLPNNIINNPYPYRDTIKFNMYIDTSGLNFTHPIKGLNNLSTLKEIDLILGLEATEYTANTNIKISDNIIAPYNKLILETQNLQKVKLYTQSLLWKHSAKINNDNTINTIYINKIPYKDFAENTATQIFATGLDNIYKHAKVGSQEKLFFSKLNSLKVNEKGLLSQYLHDMMGYEYANTYRRIIDSRNKFDREFHSVMKWDTNTLDTTKVKIFGDYSKYRTSGYGLFGYNKNSTGVFVLNTHEMPTIGNRYGWFAGLSQDNFYFKNNSSSVEKSLNGELGYHIENSYGHNNKYLLRIGIDGSYRKMNRKYNIFGNSFATKSRYNSIGTFADIKYSKDIRISKNTRIEPKIGFQFAADKLTHINEKNGPIKLKVRERALFTATPKAEILISHTKEKNNDLKVETNLNYSVFKTYRKYSYLKGKISNGNTTYYYFPKDNFKINSELTFGIELQKPNYGLGTKVFYDLNRKSIGYQLEYRLKF